MNISAINLNKTNFKGEIIDAEIIEDYSPKAPNLEPDKFELTKEKATTSPIKFFAATLSLALLTFAATKKTSLATIKSLEKKLKLKQPMDKLGKAVYLRIRNMSRKFPEVEVTSAKTFFQNIASKAVGAVDNFAKAGISATEKEGYTNFKVAALYGKNAVRKATASLFGLGTASLLAIRRHKDENANGVPDKAEKALSTAKEIVEAIPTVAAAVNLA